MFSSINEIAFIPGPLDIDWISDSQCLENITKYNIDIIFNAFKNIMNTEDSRTDESNPYEWKILKYFSDYEYIEISFSVFDEDLSDIWAGSMIRCECGIEKLLDIWIDIKKQFSAIWIHDSECNIYSINAFIDIFLNKKKVPIDIIRKIKSKI